MFDLNEALKHWKRSHQNTCGVEDLEELESHLLEHVDDLRETGLSEEEAFVQAVSRMGSPKDIGREFAKVRSAGRLGAGPVQGIGSAAAPGVAPDLRDGFDLDLQREHRHRQRREALYEAGGLDGAWVHPHVPRRTNKTLAAQALHAIHLRSFDLVADPGALCGHPDQRDAPLDSPGWIGHSALHADAPGSPDDDRVVADEAGMGEYLEGLYHHAGRNSSSRHARPAPT